MFTEFTQTSLHWVKKNFTNFLIQYFQSSNNAITFYLRLYYEWRSQVLNKRKDEILYKYYFWFEYCFHCRLSCYEDRMRRRDMCDITDSLMCDDLQSYFGEMILRIWRASAVFHADRIHIFFALSVPEFIHEHEICKSIDEKQNGFCLPTIYSLAE